MSVYIFICLDIHVDAQFYLLKKAKKILDIIVSSFEAYPLKYDRVNAFLCAGIDRIRGINYIYFVVVLI